MKIESMSFLMWFPAKQSDYNKYMTASSAAGFIPAKSSIAQETSLKCAANSHNCSTHVSASLTKKYD